MCAKVYAFCCFGGFQRGPAFIEELLSIIEYANKKEFTSLIVVHTNRREPDVLLIIGLPNGPTAHFKLSKLVLRKDIKNHGNPTNHEPELVLNNFTTRLGHRIGRIDYLQAPNGFLLSPAFFRLIQSLFPQEPNFRGRRVVTFHNQQDFIFFRHHRAKRPRIPKLTLLLKQNHLRAYRLECGPRFTLKLISLQHGTFDPRGGEFEWVHKVIHLSVNSFQYIDFISLS
ncbi:putative anticodon-binding, Brix domain-containing protein [Rosa chinensis]|uniref:Putative anticodon-binding, Brix domain-containing protein n=1 Tax=Rosa chinensis TaxID=74649 RepID=A0A2P6RGV0_ROSCH|nr:putative anticodon-binding, Brix domain-containing protein [Rosa chinensis]